MCWKSLKFVSLFNNSFGICPVVDKISQKWDSLSALPFRKCCFFMLKITQVKLGTNQSRFSARENYILLLLPDWHMRLQIYIGLFCYFVNGGCSFPFVSIYSYSIKNISFNTRRITITDNFRRGFLFQNSCMYTIKIDNWFWSRKNVYANIYITYLELFTIKKSVLLSQKHGQTINF